MKKWIYSRFPMRREMTICLGLAILTIAVYLPVLHHGFVNYDDHAYVLLNPHVRAGLTWDGVGWAFTTFSQSNWHPLTWLSHMMDCQLFGLSAGWHHAMSLFLHAANAVLLFWVLRRMTGAIARSALVAALFAVHPLHVESVAWIAERKDVLSTFFWMLTLLAYERCVRRPSRRGSAAVAGLMALGLMAKPMLVTAPCLLLVLDWWPLGRFAGAADVRAWMRRLGKLAAEKIPLFALATGSCVMTLIAQNHGGALISRNVLPPGERLANATVAYATYLEKAFWPVDLAVIYPHPGRTPVTECLGAIALLAVITWVVVRYRERSYGLAGWLWYLGTLVPVIGLVQVGEQAMADRYTYVPLIGLFVAMVWGVSDALDWILARLRLPVWRRAILTTIAMATVAACGAATWRQERYWRDTESLFAHALQVTRNNHLAHQGLGIALMDQGRVAEAIEEHRAALRIKPDFPEAHNSLGIALARQGRFDDAIAEYREALRLKPNDADEHNNLGVALARLGKAGESIAEYRESLRLNPEQANAHNNLGVALGQQGKSEDAMDQFAEAVRLRPDFADARNNLGIALVAAGRFQEGIEQYLKALQIKPDYLEAHYNLGIGLGRQGRMLEASEQFREVLRLKPDHAGAQKYLQATLEAMARNVGPDYPKR